MDTHPTLVEHQVVPFRLSQGLKRPKALAPGRSTISLLKRFRIAILVGGLLLDIGCGTGELFKYIRGLGYDYIGSDLIRFETYPEGEDFRTVDLDTGRVDMLDGVANVVACVETIEHVQNPRAIMGELARLARPGGLIVVTTPNQISIMSKLCLLLRNQFPAFQERPGLYPAHITALLPIDLLRMANELGLVEPILRYSNSGRIPGTRWHWPWPLRGHNFSDNVLLAARRPM